MTGVLSWDRAMKRDPTHIRLAPAETVSLLASYASKRLREQAQAVLPSVAYLLLFQLLILRVPLRDAVSLALGIGLAILGLAVFLEGLLIGLMPLGEQIGTAMPRKWPLTILLGFALLLGVAATLAEPAIGVLRTAGSNVTPWDAPLLYALLDRYSGLLFVAIAVGVGLATVIGMLRFRFGWSLKPLAIGISAAALVLTVLTYAHPNLRHIAGIAWDSGGITTGPVTVPLVLALGIGISRTYGRSDSSTAGFGVVTLASLVPVIAVLGLGLVLSSVLPEPMSRAEFADPSNLASVSRLFSSQAEAEAAQAAAARAGAWTPQKSTGGVAPVTEVLRRASLSSVQAVIPLSLFLILVLFLALREKPPRANELFLGLFLSLAGMALLHGGLELGLTRLGGEVGSRLPAAFSVTPIEEKTSTINDFSLDMVERTVLSNGQTQESILTQRNGRLVAEPFDRSRYDAQRGTYRYTPSRAPLLGADRRLAGFTLVLLFALVLGYTATMAEPALAALGVTVEELSVGTFRKAALIRAVGVGVGLGMTFGVARILWDIPLLLLLVPPYIVVAILTMLSTEDYVNVAWDCAGVTTGPVTVPLIVTLGLGIGGQLVGIVEGFGILALASVYPILTVLLTGLRAAFRERAAKGR